jgi:hypothetical protein
MDALFSKMEIEVRLLCGYDDIITRVAGRAKLLPRVRMLVIYFYPFIRYVNMMV